MLHNPWVMSWLISAICWLAACVCLVRTGLTTLHAMLLATPFFTGPLFVAVGGANSFVFLLDVVTPFIFVTLLPRWSEIPARAKNIGVLLAIGLAIVPLAVTVAFNPARMELLFVGINFYRVMGIIGLFWLATVAPVRAERTVAFREGGVLMAFTWMAVVLAGSLLLQYLGLIDGNVFYNWGQDFKQNMDQTADLAVVGLFRGSLGFMGIMGVAAFAATRGKRPMLELLGIAGALGGVLMVVLVASKTSLLIACVLLALGLAKSATGMGKLIAGAILVGAILVVVGEMVVPMLPEHYVEQIFGTFTMEQKSLDSLDERMRRWQIAVGFLGDQPLTAVGLALPVEPTAETSGLSYWHNEYLSMVMNGGIFSFGAYMGALALLGGFMRRKFRMDRPVVVFAVFMFVNGLLQGLTVGHLVPGLLYTSTTGMCLLAYGMSFNGEAAPEAEYSSEPSEMSLVVQA